MKQLTLLREKALLRYKTLAKGSETSDYQARYFDERNCIGSSTGRDYYYNRLLLLNIWRERGSEGGKEGNSSPCSRKMNLTSDVPCEAPGQSCSSCWATGSWNLRLAVVLSWLVNFWVDVIFDRFDLIGSRIDWLSYCLTDLIGSRVDWLIEFCWLSDWWIDWLIHWLVARLTEWFFGLAVCLIG